MPTVLTSPPTNLPFPTLTASPPSTMEGGDEADDDSLALEPEDQPVLLPSVTLDVQTAVQIEDQPIILPSTHPGLAENQESATDFVQQIQAGQATVHIPSTHEDLSQPIGSEPVIDLNIQDDPAPEQYVYVPGRNEGHLLQQKYNILVNEINKICAQSTSYLPIHVDGWDNQDGQTNDISATYIGRSPPLTSNEILAKKIIALTQYKHDRSSFLPT
uniref:Uncharacterized protein n=1 Tax=Oryza meridionalis TaxID=40149 RepID=A0A0E0D5H1_9ORYZ